MYLANLIVVNYRSCKLLEVDLFNDEPNIFIGINDCGKTTILKAIGLLLDEKPVYHSLKNGSFKKDLSNSALSNESFEALLTKYSLPSFFYNPNQTLVLGKFVIEDHDIDDENAPFSNQLLWAIENLSSQIWFMRAFDSDSSIINSFILTKDSFQDNEFLTLWNRTAVDLAKRTKEFSIKPNEIENVNKQGRFSNLEKIRAIYNKVSLQICWAEYKIEKADKGLFPVFRYLDWNCSLDDIKKIAADAMATKIEAHIIPLKNYASIAAIEVEQEINQQLMLLKDSIGEMLPNITGIKTKIYFEVKETVTDILINKLNADGDIHLDLQGEGIKRQIWFALIKAGALASIESGMTNTKFIWAFDEPETHLYPTAQRQFFDIIKEVSQTNVQTLISTHSTIFIDKSKLNIIKSVSLNNIAYTEFNNCNSVDEIFEALELRNSDFLFYDKFLVTEGDTEAYLIPELYKIHTGSTLKDDNIQLINLTGKNKWIEGKKALENVLTGFKKSLEFVIYLFDADMKLELGTSAITSNFFFAGNQDIEDSVSTEIWIEIVKEATDDKVLLSIEDIDQIKASIPANVEIRSNEKFFKQLQKLVKQKYSEVLEEPISHDVLDSKGFASAQALIKQITSMNQVCPQISLAFNKLNQN
ncbi:AAA family ATPase [uncultured Mucilaginibacter sp.]|uniref:AAA family ATPase n=1 Tax=uncultured Mucilaginibacter sp. TaxID=797541 RepID=UPI00261FE919|nr:AAA family ATPase [uncultured Mucilaginibacter sp.]